MPRRPLDIVQSDGFVPPIATKLARKSDATKAPWPLSASRVRASRPSDLDQCRQG